MPISWTPLEGFGEGGGGVTRVEAMQAGIPRTPKIARIKSRVNLKEGKALAAWRTPSGGGIGRLAGVGWAATAEPHMHTSCWGEGRLASVEPPVAEKGCRAEGGSRGAGVCVPWCVAVWGPGPSISCSRTLPTWELGSVWGDWGGRVRSCRRADRSVVTWAIS